jgi:acyl-CoA thioester hydrolase
VEQRVEVIGPDRFLDFLALHFDVRRARVATVMQQHTIAMGGEFFGQRHELIEPAAAAGDQCDKRTVVTNDLITEIDAPNIGYWHDGSPFNARSTRTLCQVICCVLKTKHPFEPVQTKATSMPDTSAGTTDLTSRDTFAVWTTVSVRYGDLDPNHHVNNGAINQYFEDGRVGFRLQRLADVAGNTLSGFAVVKFTANYLAPAHYPGDVEIGTVVTRIGGSSYGLGQGIYQDGSCVATAEIVTVQFDPETSKSIALSEEFRRLLEAAMAPASN